MVQDFSEVDFVWDIPKTSDFCLLNISVHLDEMIKLSSLGVVLLLERVHTLASLWALVTKQFEGIYFFFIQRDSATVS